MTRLQEYMDRHGWTRCKLSRATGIKLSTISALCEGRRGGRMSTYREMARVMMCKVSDLVED